MFDSCLRLSPNHRGASSSRLARPLCRANLHPAVYLRTGISGALYLASSWFRLRKPPSSRCIEERQRHIFTSLRSHNSGRQTGKPFFLSVSLLLLLVPSRFRFPQALLSSTFLAISVKYFKDRLPIVYPLPLPSSTILGWGIREQERLDLPVDFFIRDTVTI